MRKITVIFLSVLFTLGLTSCGNQTDNSFQEKYDRYVDFYILNEDSGGTAIPQEYYLVCVGLVDRAIEELREEGIKVEDSSISWGWTYSDPNENLFRIGSLNLEFTCEDHTKQYALLFNSSLG